MSNSCGVFCSCCTYLMLSLKMDQFLISREFVFLSKNLIYDYFLIWVCHLDFAPCFEHHCLCINNISLFCSFVYIVCLFLSQALGLFVLDVIDLSTCLLFQWQKWGGMILAFHKFKYSISPQNQWDNGLVSSFVRMLGMYHHIQVPHQWAHWGILMQSGHIPTSIAPYMITVGTYPGVGPGSRFISSTRLSRPNFISMSTSTSPIVIVIISSSIPTLTSVPKCLLSILSVIWSSITLPIVSHGNCYSYHLTYDCSICLLIGFYNWVCNCFYNYDFPYFHFDFLLY